MAGDLFDTLPKASTKPAAVDEMLPLQAPRSKGLEPHPGVPYAMLGYRQCRRLWGNYRMTTYSAAKAGLTPSQACAVLEDRDHVAMTERAGRDRLDALIAHWRANRGR